MIERQVDIETADGTMTTFVYHPDEGGPFPVVLYLMDAPSIRPALKDMASRMASHGYYVMLPFLFYRGSAYKEFGADDAEMHERRELMKTVTRDGIVTDADALLSFADDDPAARGGDIGAVGFCMSGPMVLALAQRRADRVAAVASIHGAWLVAEDRDDSPHREVDQIRAEVYFAWADDDPTAPAEQIPVMESALSEAGVRHHIDFMEGALHGFAPPGGPRHDEAASEQHWERVLDLFERNL
ncbi:MAG: dienelactone hydrolase family protein [Acidimicrobiales bacterium]|nr:dienelactone hydrolase family protein [Acidimicrobiales bacterium]